MLTWVMSGLCVVFTLAHYTSAHLATTSLWYRVGHFGHLPATAIWSGQWPALFTTLFIHGQPDRPFLTLGHLGFNLIVLLQAGRALEATLHPVAYYLFFVSAAMIGSSAELAVSGSTGVGASGVVYAMFGLLWAGRRKDEEWADVANPLAVRLVVGWAIVCLILTRLNVIAIANAAHFGGLLFGLGVGWFFVERKYRLLGGLVLGGQVGLLAISLVWLPWSPYWTFWKGVQARKALRYQEAIEWFEKSRRRGMTDWQVESNIIWTRYVEEHPDAKQGTLQIVPEQPDFQRFPGPGR
ncbi:MAG: rhomboid family intramembrane serine protease [Fimbriimonas ginsengisoli]|nr:rhomboid family intramembrane serine protease [Fimbriimonas ginsengisoli]